MSTPLLLGGGLETRIVTGSQQNWLLGILAETSLVVQGADQGSGTATLLLQADETGDQPSPWDYAWRYCPNPRAIRVRTDDPSPPRHLLTVSAGGERYVLIQLEGRRCQAADPVPLTASKIELSPGQLDWAALYPDSLDGRLYVMADLHGRTPPLRLPLLLGPRDGLDPARRREIGIVP